MRISISLMGLVLLACAPESFDDDRGAGGKADDGEEMAEDACLWDGRYNDGRCDDSCGQPDPDCFIWDEQIPNGWLELPLQVSTHFPIVMSYHNTNEDGSVDYKSQDFNNGVPINAIEHDFHCYVWGSREGSFRGTGPYRTRNPEHGRTIYATHTTVVAGFRIATNDEGLESVTCWRTARGQVPDLAITWRQVRDAFWNQSTGAYLALEPLQPQYPNQ